ncbi:hypothetical protein [Aneurinibacillus migulanus]|uniref:Uncharacterized protein n=1 Tax=Aneurinibacillus migulanus TaxID=47500 RepID=A0A0D1XEU2_ANEMI|nr:hypothetical protein [Aneurinibacillus migulanus]KIV52916.1 hypothetical protein TS65_22745 [Aneurinibacillus migulanus]KON95194.1 hypothetical protein AF333_06585 [Aneurinibacillus migulanus]MED0890935.1 hypothetical protein [Aneurinibacillus migulanus]MED1616627.1 hypothetical protein [Aneurinibacillus migulanus]SDI82970.1 hypothetical protein SAMN04487909_10890 [Aneurinibacillus migulanus]
MTPQQAESLRKESEELKQGVDQALSQRTPEQKQRDLDALLEAAQRVHKRVRQAKGGESV